MAFTPDQTDFLLRPINPLRVKQLQGHSHLEAWDVRAHLNRVFGFGNWSLQTQVDVLYSEERAGKDGQPRWHVGARAWAQLTIRDPESHIIQCSYEDVAADESVNPNRGEALDQAVKSAASGALKRCAVNLGDQFGLSLYRKGSTAPVVVTTTPWAHGSTTPSVQDENPDVMVKQRAGAEFELATGDEASSGVEIPSESGAFK